MTSSVPMVVAALVLVGIALVLLKLGFFPRRQGSTRYCRKCRYNLTGLEGDKCPECGGVISRTGVIVGDRHRRRAIGWTGILLMVLGLGWFGLMGYQWARDYDWYHLRPTSWTLRDLRSGNVPTATRALAELQRRLDAGELSDAQRHELHQTAVAAFKGGLHSSAPALLDLLTGEFAQMTPEPQDQYIDLLTAGLKAARVSDERNCLAQLQKLSQDGRLTPTQRDRLCEAALAFEAAPGSISKPSLDWLVTYLGDRALAGELSPAQRDRFFRQLITTTLAVRPRPLAGDQVPIQVAYTALSPGSDWRMRFGFTEWSLDGDPPHPAGGSSSGSIGSGSMGTTIPPTSPGKHTLTVVAETAVYLKPDGGDGSGGDIKPLYSRKTRQRASFTTVAKSAEAPVKWIDDRSLAPAIRASMKIRDLRLFRPESRELHCMVDTKNPPLDLAFELFLVIDGREYPLSTLTCRKGKSVGNGIYGRLAPEVDLSGRRFGIILRSSEPAMRRTVDLTSAWKGEIRFDDLALEPLSK